MMSFFVGFMKRTQIFFLTTIYKKQLSTVGLCFMKKNTFYFTESRFAKRSIILLGDSMMKIFTALILLFVLE
jgi:hypothetical protein